MKRYVKILSLKPGEETVIAYKKAHDEIWPEIVKGIREVGISEMALYLYGRQVVMIMETEDHIDIEEAMSQLSAKPRQSEWEDFVGKYQECLPGSSSDEKWHLMEKIFSLPK